MLKHFEVIALRGSKGRPLTITLTVQFEDPLRLPLICIAPALSSFASKIRGFFLDGRDIEDILDDDKASMVLMVGDDDDSPTALLLLLILSPLAPTMELLMLLVLPDGDFFFFAPPERGFRREIEDEEATDDGRTLGVAGELFPVVEDTVAPPLANGRPRLRLRLPEEDDFPGAAFLVGKPLPMDGISKK